MLYAATAPAAISRLQSPPRASKWPSVCRDSATGLFATGRVSRASCNGERMVDRARTAAWIRRMDDEIRRVALYESISIRHSGLHEYPFSSHPSVSLGSIAAVPGSPGGYPPLTLRNPCARQAVGGGRSGELQPGRVRRRQSRRFGYETPGPRGRGEGCRYWSRRWTWVLISSSFFRCARFPPSTIQSLAKMSAEVRENHGVLRKTARSGSNGLFARPLVSSLVGATARSIPFASRAFVPKYHEVCPPAVLRCGQRTVVVSRAGQGWHVQAPKNLNLVPMVAARQWGSVVREGEGMKGGIQGGRHSRRGS